jgi:hypothetical protein
MKQPKSTLNSGYSRIFTNYPNKKPLHQHQADGRGLLFIHPDSKGKASCSPPERHLINNNELELITPQLRDSSTIIFHIRKRMSWKRIRVKGEKGRVK